MAIALIISPYMQQYGHLLKSNLDVFIFIGDELEKTNTTSSGAFDLIYR